MICSWRDCQNEACCPQLDRDGVEWANLCQPHAVELDEAIGSLDAKTLLRAWARAHAKHPSRERLIRNANVGVGAILKLRDLLQKCRQ